MTLSESERVQNPGPAGRAPTAGRVSRFLGRHLWLQVVLSLLAASALIMLLFPGRSFASVLVRTAVTSVGAIAVLVVRRRREKRAAGGADDLVSLDLKLRDGEVPEDPQERRAMRDLVAQRLHRTRHRRAALVLLGVLFGGLTVLLALTGNARQSIGFGVLTVVFVGWIAYQGHVQDRRLRSMRAALADDGPAERAG
ncbi:hypothetical protein GCM10018980_15770 [Streptomyces capoamus]|uniref:Transmembrane protein n=1 Tax=Streptomyces capoamus TaxID=68183 RepID=A0A919ETZ6_9ACTN|nr:hypothetical protein [Streptomyces capoamus]GGW13739.1 hypothetical protein GCM10010501_18770 [Streptomyces libani subsp. rufus]GHG40980.1 hypothetical protein GCM10018980_15770 [Streptomyces capoamus]